MNDHVHGNEIGGSTGRFSVLSQVREGMGVYDVEDNHIGSVALVHFGAASETQQEHGTGPARATRADAPDMRDDTIIDNLAEAFSPNDVPRELQEKLLYSGFI